MHPQTTPQQLKTSLQASGTRGVALDIDETLSQTEDKWMERLLAAIGNPENLTPREAREKYNRANHLPHYDKEKHKHIVDEILHSNEFQTLLPLIEDAQHITQQIHELIPVVAYITARPETVLKGTQKWLSTHGFPEAPIIMHPKETFALGKRNAWKAELLEDLFPEVCGIVDNDPRLLDGFSPAYKGTLYLYGEGEMHITTNLNVIPCKDWKSVLEAVKTHTPCP